MAQVNLFDLQKRRAWCCIHWTRGCLNWVNWEDSACHKCISQGRDARKLDDPSAPLEPETNDLDYLPALKAAYLLHRSLNGRQWLPISLAGTEHCLLDELHVATYQVLEAMRSTIERTPRTSPRRPAADKLQADYASYPKTLPGVLHLFRSHSVEAGVQFFQDIVGQVQKYAGPAYSGAMIITASPGVIDWLPRPESFDHRKAIHQHRYQAWKMAETVLVNNVQVECRPSMLNKASMSEMSNALDRAELALARAVARTLEKYSDGREYEAAVKLQTEIRKYRLVLRETTSAPPARDELAVLLCRALETVTYSTTVVEEQRIVVRDPPAHFPV
ncbi:uncharacterized protein LTR77_010384 [Saxophila tyrrhenica]|uniref:Uncharacterized protein n=1 Tax=Saxophila tyrrhenica TaxID=1690608 RepID=A0AAV9NXV4_9PEZI|nr:hypothetical protein LTR77_010384 [Saxophila tyrrhenica]